MLDLDYQNVDLLGLWVGGGGGDANAPRAAPLATSLRKHSYRYILFLLCFSGLDLSIVFHESSLVPSRSRRRHQVTSPVKLIENFGQDASRYRARFQASAGSSVHSHSAGRPEDEAVTNHSRFKLF